MTNCSLKKLEGLNPMCGQIWREWEGGQWAMGSGTPGCFSMQRILSVWWQKFLIDMDFKCFKDIIRQDIIVPFCHKSISFFKIISQYCTRLYFLVLSSSIIVAGNLLEFIHSHRRWQQKNTLPAPVVPLPLNKAPYSMISIFIIMNVATLL